MSEKNTTPVSLGIILDGNRRWAKEQGVPTLLGHKAGYDRFLELLDWCREAGIRTVYGYCFSTENWNRSTEEVNYLMDLIRQFFMSAALDSFKKKGYRIRLAGVRDRLPHDIQEMAKRVEGETATLNELDVVFCISYGGRDEILDAVNKILEDKGREKGPITKERFEKYLWTKDLPDPDLIIRTSGEHRLSNFLTWRSVYSELFFPKVYFPAFNKEEFHKVLQEYGERQRRFGK